MEQYSENKWTWYLLPFFLSIIGGVIAYYALRDRDPRTGMNCLKLGAVSILINVAVFVPVFIMAGISALAPGTPAW